jgi:hypothetical protein
MSQIKPKFTKIFKTLLQNISPKLDKPPLLVIPSAMSTSTSTFPEIAPSHFASSHVTVWLNWFLFLSRFL